MLSKKALQVLQAFFSKNSSIQVPIGCIDELIEIRNWIENMLLQAEEDKNAKCKA